MGKKPARSRRERIESRAGGRCEYCQAPQGACGYRFHLEHIVPVAEGGPDHDENRALACAACNLTKRDQVSAEDPETPSLSSSLRSSPLCVLELPRLTQRNEERRENFGHGSDA